MTDIHKIAEAVERFRAAMLAEGISVTGFEVATFRDEKAIEVSVPQRMIMPIGYSPEKPRTAINGITVTVRGRRHD